LDEQSTALHYFSFIQVTIKRQPSSVQTGSGLHLYPAGLIP